jgi:hypothetical protein
MKKQETVTPKLRIKEITRRLAQVHGGVEIVGWGRAAEVLPDVNRNLK